MQKSKKNRSIDRSIREMLGVVMAGGRGTRLENLTAKTSKPSIPFAGKYRIIDFTLSNCINSGIYKLCVLTQYRAHSLIQHIERGWSFFREEFGEFLELLPAQERYTTDFSYQGTADAVYQNLDIILGHKPSYVLVLAGDHVYKMDYGVMLTTHIESNADVTIGCIEVPLHEADQFGLMLIDDEQRITGFQEKPEHPEPMPGRTDAALASMGIYLFTTDFLVRALEADAKDSSSSHDFGHDILPSLYRDSRLIACPFNDLASGEKGYWRDVGTIDAYWEANLELIGVTPPLNLYDKNWPIRTHQEQLPPAKFVFDSDTRRGTAVDSMVSAGCIISGSRIKHSLLSNNVRINSYSNVEDSVLLPGVTVNRNCQIKKAVIDCECVIPAGTVIGHDMEMDRNRFLVSSKGVVLVSQDMLNNV